MKIIIVSDIRSTAKSIIPFGLKLARQTESEIDIIHVIDPRSEKVLPSSYSDSQTFALGGDKLNYEDTLHREKSRTRQGLENLLSLEASKLRYPLKINIIIEENSIEHKINEYLKNEPSPLFLINSYPDGHIFSSQKEMIDLMRISGATCLYVPPGQKFDEFRMVMLPTDFKTYDIDKYQDVSLFLRPFKPVINAVYVSKSKNFQSSDPVARKWNETASSIFKEMTIELNILTGINFTRTLINYVNRNSQNLLVLFHKKQSLIRSLFAHSLIQGIMKRTNIPVLLYSKLPY